MKHLLCIILIVIIFVLLVRSRKDKFEYKGLFVTPGSVPANLRSCEIMKTQSQNECDLYSPDIERCYDIVNEEYGRCKEHEGIFANGMPETLEERCKLYAKNKCAESDSFVKCYQNKYNNCLFEKIIVG